MVSVEHAAPRFPPRRRIVIGGGCPLAFGPTVGAGHMAMRLVFPRTSQLPSKV